MAIANPQQNTEYCDGTSGTKVEYQTPDRDVLAADYEWAGQEFNAVQMPIQYSITETLGDLIESIVIVPNSQETTAATLAKNKYYTFVASGLLEVGGGKFADPCFLIDSVTGTTKPSDLLTTNDEQFDQMFFESAENGAIEYDPVLHEYSVGYVGNDVTVTFSLGSADLESNFQIDIYENNYKLDIFRVDKSLPPEEQSPIILYTETRDKPFININIACGGSCPTRTSFSCECDGDRSCYHDDEEGTITKIFKGTANP